MQSQFWKWTRKNLKTGKDETVLVQGALRPSILGAWEYIFPEDCLPEVLSFIGRVDPDDIGALKQPGNFFKLGVLRKIFGCEKIKTEVFDEAKKIPTTIYFNEFKRALTHCKIPGVAIHIIGIKKDIFRDFDFPDGTEYHQEAL